MENRNDQHSAARKDGRAPLIILGTLTAGALATTFHFWNLERQQHVDVDQGRLRNERLLGEKLELEKRVVDANGLLNGERNGRLEAEQHVQDLERRMQRTLERQRDLEARARRADKAGRRTHELEGELARIHRELDEARLQAGDLQLALDRLRNERDALTVQLATQGKAGWMVNNAVVDAVRGANGTLTVKARRARRIRMAFDLPQELAKDANFRLTAPDGTVFTGSDPALSLERSTVTDDALAAIDLTAGMLPTERATRVHLRFEPQRKLKPGTYRIDVCSGTTYLNTVMLNLR